MPTIVDALLVTLGLDTSAYKRGVKEANDAGKKLTDAEKDALKAREDAAKKSVDSIRKVKNEIISLVAVALGARTVKDLVGSIVGGQIDLNRTAKNIGITAKELDGLDGAVESLGGKRGDLEASARAIAGLYTSLHMGQVGPGHSALAALGVNIEDAQRQLRPMKDILDDLRAGFAKYSGNPVTQNALASQIGINEATLELLRLTKPEMDALVKKYIDLSAATEESRKLALQANQQWTEFTRTLQNVATVIFTDLKPQFDSMGEGLKDFGGWVKENKPELIAFFQTLAYLVQLSARGIGLIADALPRLTNETKGKAAMDRGDYFEASKELPAGQFISGMWDKFLDYGKPDSKKLKAGASKPPPVLFNSPEGAAMLDAYIRGGGRINSAMMSQMQREGASVSSPSAFAQLMSMDQMKGMVGAGANGSARGGTTVTTTVGSVTINSKATDAKGVARDLVGELQQQNKMAVATSGLE